MVSNRPLRPHSTLKSKKISIRSSFQIKDSQRFPEGGGGTPYNGLYGEAPPERGTFFRLQVYERVGILQVEVYKRVGKSVI